MRPKRLWAPVGCVCLLAVASAWAQERGGLPGVASPGPLMTPERMTGAYSSKGSVYVLTVKGDNKRELDREAVVKLKHKINKDARWQTTQEHAEAVFVDLVMGSYEVEVTAFGYLTGHKELNVTNPLFVYREEIRLERDPSAIDLSARGMGQIPPKARGNMNKGIAALKSNKLKDANKRLDAAYKLAPSSPDLNFLLGYLWYAKENFTDSEKYLTEATTLDPQHVQALTLLGRIRLRRDDDKGARTALEQAVAADPGYWVPHNLLADVCLRAREYEKARDHAQLAMEKGKGFGNSARLVLGQALANLGHNAEGAEVLKAYLKDAKPGPLTEQARNLVTIIEKRPAMVAAGTQAPLEAVVDKAGEAELVALGNWGPPGIDDAKPPVSAGVECPSANVIEGAGRAVKQLLDDVSRYVATEDVLHQDLDAAGNPTSNEVRKFEYAASITEVKPGVLQVLEDRTAGSQPVEFPRQIATLGLPALALVFHPDVRDDYVMECEGLGQWNSQATWLVHFRQRDDKPARLHGYTVDKTRYPVGLKGRAWISAATLQPVRLEAEMVKAMPDIQLLSEHFAVEYGPVAFPKKNVQLWLPKRAELYFYFRKHRYFRRHSFDKFMLFSVDSEEKRKAPRATDTRPGTGPA